MIRLIQRRLIIPRGDTGSFSIPVLKQPNAGDIAVFTIFDCSTRTRMFQKQVAVEGDTISIAFTHTDTVNLKPGKYFWDIKFYTDPVFVEDELVDGVEVDSYYAGYSLPDCEIRETADNYLVAPDGPDSYLTPEQLDIVTEAIAALQDAITKTETNVTHYPQIRDGVWYVWDAEVGDFVSTDSHTPTKVSELENDSGYLTTESDPTVPAWAKQATKPSYTASEVGALPADTYIPQKTSDLTNDSDFAVDANYVHTDNNYTTEEKTKLNSIAEGAEVNVNADWDAVEGDAAILHKPTNVSAFENDAGYLTEHQDLSNYVQKTDYATNTSAGIIKINTARGLAISDDNKLELRPASDLLIKYGAASYNAIAPDKQHQSTFYGLAKAAGDTTQSKSSNAVGTYTNEAKAAIQTMLDVPSNADVAAKQDALTFDSAPTANSTNPVTSGGVYNAIANVNTMKIHICGQDEYDSETGMPTVANPDSQSFYLVPGGADSNLFIEWVYVNGAWERFGSADVDLSGYATKADTILETSLSRGRKADTTVGEGSFAFGSNVEASGNHAYASGGGTVASGHNSHAEGFYSKATAQAAHVEGGYNQAIGICSHAEGGFTFASGGNIASGMSAHAEGNATLASGSASHAEGVGTIANSAASHVSGIYNVEDTYINWPEWTANTEYAINDKIKITTINNGETVITGYICKTPNSDAEFTSSNWIKDTHINYVHIIGNGTSNSARSNAYALDWDGNGHYMGDVYVHANADSTGGTKVATVADIPDVLVQDVQVNGSTIVDNGVANVPIASANKPGTVIVGNAGGLYINPNTGVLMVAAAQSNEIRYGTQGFNYKPITPAVQRQSVFYGLAQAAGVDTSQDTLAIGQYSDLEKTAIKAMLGVQDGLKVVRLI